MPDKSPIPGWEATISKVARKLYDGKLKGDLSPEMIRKHSDYLLKAMHTGFGEEGLAKIDAAQMAQLRDNIFYFSGFKNLQQMKEISKLLTDKDGQVRSFSDFKKDVLAIDATYNVNYLGAEYEFATHASHSISFWHTAQAEKDTLPFLRWSAVMDDRTGAEDASLNGVTRPVDDPFWQTRYPPIHWRCRCLVTQEGPDAAVTPHQEIEQLGEPAPYFRFNSGIDNVIFPVDKDRFATVHPYAENTTAEEYKTVIDTVDDILKEGDPDADN